MNDNNNKNQKRKTNNDKTFPFYTTSLIESSLHFAIINRIISSPVTIRKKNNGYIDVTVNSKIA